MTSYKTGKIKMDTITIFDQHINFKVLSQLNRQESQCYIYVLVFWNGHMDDDLQQLEV